MNFDDWFNTGKNWQYDKDACEDAFEAGQKSRQEADVDLQRILDNAQDSLSEAYQYVARKFDESNTNETN